MTRLLLLLAPLLLAARCDEPQVLTTGQRATAEAAQIQTAAARHTCPPVNDC